MRNDTGEFAENMNRCVHRLRSADRPPKHPATASHDARALHAVSMITQAPQRLHSDTINSAADDVRDRWMGCAAAAEHVTARPVSDAETDDRVMTRD